MLTIDNLTVQLDQLLLADQMNLSLKQGEVNVIIGPNGTGKSTLLKTLFGDIKPKEGKISFDGEPLDYKQLTQWRERIGYMPQDIRLDANLTVIEVVLLGKLDKLSWRVDEEMLREAIEVLDQIGLAHLSDRDIRTLSGGQCQMVLFAQAILRSPQVLMLDEPVSALDLHFQQVMLGHLIEQTEQHRWTALMVLHDLNLAAQYADNLIVLKEGKVVAQGKPTDVLSAELIEQVYGVPAQVSYDLDGIPFVRTFRYA
ncbi:ATP-binding cassette domain-containing protein [Vibrio sp. CAIM 722]|uniref:ATP-binding cassette domain-containing protein n=1 Tax=Vibrio eleionomae TaxID=2653505 RepID=A0A7X4RVX2_9VIBR|nr:ABC transporter ATP-binding protein [Vibrio eleionomae]MZI95003.1 ATP-binding cassette domain-containing protein [Vibrio eleionomae]